MLSFELGFRLTTVMFRRTWEKLMWCPETKREGNRCIMNTPLERTSARREVKDNLQRIKTGVEGEGQEKERERFQ